MSLDFFDDIMIPLSALQQPARFDEAEQVWVWGYEDGNRSLFMDPLSGSGRQHTGQDS